MHKSLCQTTQAAQLCVVAPNICGSPVWNLRHFTLMAYKIFILRCDILVVLVEHTIIRT